MHTMTAPRWVDVVLEGGGLTLERALLDYRRLATLVRGDWRLRALEVQELARQVSARELEVAEVEERARHRATVDPSFASGLRLIDDVKASRDVLCGGLKTSPGKLCVALDELAEEAHEAALVGRAWRRFSFERSLWSVGAVAMLGIAPVVSWREAERLGGVKLDFVGLIDSPGPVVGVLAVLLAVVASQLRLESWYWLYGVRPGGWMVTVSTSAAVIVCCALPPLQRSETGLAVFVACCGLVVRALLLWWRSQLRDPTLQS